jgi:hypothetical protein
MALPSLTYGWYEQFSLQGALPMSTTDAFITRDPNVVKSELIKRFSMHVTSVFSAARTDTSIRALEVAVWAVLLDVGRMLLSAVLEFRACRATEVDLAQRGLRPSQVTQRVDGHYCRHMTSTLGPICFALGAYRERIGDCRTTRVPAQDLFPAYPKCRSTELCLEWECHLGSMHPFRTAQSELKFFTHSAVTLEDTTIASHTLAVGAKVSRKWLYRERNEIRKILKNRALRAANTNMPMVFVSSDAHSLRRFVDGTWCAQWKMANGLRIWCVDSRTGNIIHLGGEFTWGNCEHVESIVQDLIKSGHLPVGGDYGKGVVAQLVWVTDGMPWIEEYLLKWFPTAVFILDAFHVIEKLSKFAAIVYGKGEPEAQRWYKQAYEAAFGAPKLPKTKSTTRTGHRKRKGARMTRFARRRVEQMMRPRKATTLAEPLLNLLEGMELSGERESARDALVRYVKNNAYRMDYAMYIQQGYQIGSGAMESLHPVASQHRLKRSGPGWRPEAAQAIFNLRMLDLVGRWHEFWCHDDLKETLESAFEAA